MAFELKILTDLSAMPKVVETNIDEVEPIIKAAIDRVDGLLVTDNKEDILAADADAAKLRKMADAIKRFRIDHIALWDEPMKAFETKCKSAEKRLTEAAGTLTEKTGEVKEIWRGKKRGKCADLWAKLLLESFEGDEQLQTCDGVKAFFAYWTDGKTKGTWLNSSVTMAAVEKAMREEIARIGQVLESAKAVYANEPPEVAAKARIALLKNMSLTDAITAVTEWKAEQKAIAEAAERQRAAEAQKAQAEEAAKRALEAKRAQMAQEQAAAQSAEQPKAESVQNAPTAPAAVPPPSATAPASKPVETYKLAVTGTREALIELKRYGLTLGIVFENLEK